MASTSSSFATTLAPTRETPTSSQLLTSSISSLNSTSSRHASSQISKIYRQSSTLFLTRRLPESLSTILPVIATQLADDTNATPEPAPIAKASRTTRIKVWSLYLTILNAVVELDPEEGKQAFGSAEWRTLVSKVRDGEVWEEVVQNGYGGVEGDVDSDVVINLATLLLAHARTQKTNQARLETYLATCTTPHLDISSRLSSRSPAPKHRHPSPSRPHQNRHNSTSGTDTPRDLNARVKILELYTLHVLLRNNEWDYAREFISISPVLDEERREAFLQALASLHDEQYEAERREKEERRYQEEQLERDIEEARRRRAENKEMERRREEEERVKRENRKSAGNGSEVDYGVDETPRPGSSRSRSSATPNSKSKSNATPNPSSNSKKLTPANKPAPIPPTLLTRAVNIVTNMRKLLESLAGSFKTRPMFLLQILAFVIGFLAVLSRRDVKERLKRVLGNGWLKVRRTVGMGVKVSYI